jgi:dihydroneopterin aldolase
MKLDESYIYLNHLRFHAYHGVLPQERSVGNDYLLDVRIKYNVANAMKSDNVNDTLNYAEVYKLICQEMMVPSNLLERVAYRIADRIARRFIVTEAIDIKLTKLNPPMEADCEGAGVELHLINDKTLSD